MLDQSFSFKNFRDIYDRENRRGQNLDKKFFPDLVDLNLRIKVIRDKIRTLRKTNTAIGKDELNLKLAAPIKKLEELKNLRGGTIDARLEEVSRVVSEKGFQLALSEAEGPQGKMLYPIEGNAPAYFTAKQLQINLSRLYKVKPSVRRSIVNQTRSMLNCKFGLFVVRTDITSFFESIDREKLLVKLSNDQLLSFSSRRHIQGILRSYTQLSGNSRGIPRGVGISAYLSELYMREIDSEIRQMESLTYYARYVDDIIAIFSPTAMDDVTKFLPAIRSTVESSGLSLNEGKTTQGPCNTTTALNFEYLGYRFTVIGGNCEIGMSSGKQSRYRSRIDRCFEAYERTVVTSQKAAFKLLVSRIKFLTGNTRLLNNKRHAYTGIYFTNSSMTKINGLSSLDQYLRHKTMKLDSATLQDRLDSYSFVDGFLKRPFYRYNAKDLTKIVEAWRYDE
ncbi:MAG: antiviral reverse transcriptase Drt3a [Parasphingorhabdus sp.]|nr:antiviral reverse transcriptase Drt3a [Parasphingorhabdus sp.]